MTKNIYIFVMLLAGACATKPIDSPTTSKGTDPDSLTLSMNTDEEDFNAFFTKFITDSSFQVERTKFPFRVVWTIEDGETTHETEKENWTHSTFYYHDSYATRQQDAYTQEIKIYGDSAKIEQRGVEQWHLR